MLYKTLLSFIQLLNNHLKLSFKLNEDIAFLSPVKEPGNGILKNRIAVSMVNIERETGGGIHFQYQATDKNHSRKTPLGWQLNMYILIAAIFTDRQYAESLQVFAGTLAFIQKNNVIEITDHGTSFIVEPVNLTFHELSNLWGILGGNYYPSILCKIRLVTIDEQEIIDLSTGISQPETNSYVKP